MPFRHCLALWIVLLTACDVGGTADDAPAAPAEPPAVSSDPPANSPEWFAREALNFAASQQRSIDRFVQGRTVPVDADPPRLLDQWAPARGAALETFFENRYGARIAVSLLRPGGEQPRALPTVVIIPGLGSGVRSAYYFLAEDLAEHGYLALVFDPQAQGASDARGRPETCEPGGAWQEPQEMGLREQGECAGEPPPTSPIPDGSTVSLLAHMALGTDVDHSSTAGIYQSIAPTFVLGALDATAWLLSDANPWRAWVDVSRIGLAGHSAGAYGAAQAANGDPLFRFRAAVALDGYHPIDLGVGPRVPTLWIQSEQEQAPRARPPQNPRTLHPVWASFDTFRAAGMDTGVIVLRSSAHLDFSDAAGLASRNGSRYASYFTLAWFDQFLRGDASGGARLFAQTFDDSIDVSSIGTGGIGPDLQNQPPMIEGLPLTDAYSYYYPGALAALGADCVDMRIVPCHR